MLVVANSREYGCQLYVLCSLSIMILLALFFKADIALIFIVFSAVAKHIDAQFGPTDITRTEGDLNEFIPCPFDGINTPFWKINETFYHYSVLPCPFIPSTSPAGLVITVVDRSISGTSFQCFAPGTGRDTSIMASSVGVLTVVQIPSCMLHVDFM